MDQTAPPQEGVVVSCSVFRHEIREGMRKVEVRVRTNATPAQDYTITEWVPVVLLDRLTVGKSVLLMDDPAGKKRKTLGL
jgi:hypothetical protein